MKLLLSSKFALRISLVALVVVSIAAGYYQARWLEAEKKNLELQETIIDLRTELELE